MRINEFANASKSLESIMATTPHISGSLSAREFAEGLLVGLAASHNTQINANRVHKAFFRVLNEVKASNALNVDFSEVDYDPLYGLSGWLDQFLARAQRDLMISSPNPSYGRIQIKVTPAQGERLLARNPNGAILKELSQRFAENLKP